MTKNGTTLSAIQLIYATDKEAMSLEEALVSADIFLGLFSAASMTPIMLLVLVDKTIVFAMANPNPEINYQIAIETRKDIIMATGRSDHPNQVNNVLGFPYIFRGAMDVRATKIHEKIKMAALYALAALPKESVPEQVNIAY